MPKTPSPSKDRKINNPYTKKDDKQEGKSPVNISPSPSKDKKINNPY